MDHPVSVESYTIPQAAQALGRSAQTLRRWIEDDRIPGPVLEDTHRHLMVYSAGELAVIARHLAEMESEMAYFVSRDSNAKERLQQAVHGYRMQYI